MTLPLYRNRDFRRLWVGQALSGLGSSVSGLAMPLLVLAVTGSPLGAGAVGAIGLATWVVVSVPAGALVDRWSRRAVLLTCDAVRGLVLAGLAVAVVTGRVSWPMIVAAVLVENAAGAFFGPAHSAALRHIVPAPQLATAAARDEARTYGAELAGPPLGGLLFGLARWVPFLGNAISYAASFIAVQGIRRSLRAERAKHPAPLRREVVAGLRFVLTEPFLRAALVWVPLMNVAMHGVFLALVLALRDHGTPPGFIGAAQSVAMAGGLAGTFLSPWLQARLRMPALVISASWLACALVAAMGVLPAGYLLPLPLFLLMLIAPALNTAFFAYQVAMTPDRLQGRVQGALGMMSQALSPLGPLIAGALYEVAGAAGAFGCLAGVLVIAAMYATASRGIRGMRPLAVVSAAEHTEPAS